MVRQSLLGWPDLAAGTLGGRASGQAFRSSERRAKVGEAEVAEVSRGIEFAEVRLPLG